MKVLNEKEHKYVIILDDLDEVEIGTLKGNKEKIVIKCINSILHIDELSGNDSNFYDEEQKAISAMKKYLDENDKK